MSRSSPNSATHTIRLRAAWRSEGSTHARRFHRPTGLEPTDRVWLVADGADRIAAASLNGAPVEFSGAGRCEIAALLQPTNELTLETTDERLLASVRLEIESG